MSSERGVSVNEQNLLEELTRFRSAVRDFALGRHLIDANIQPSKSQLKEHVSQNSKLLQECDTVRSFVDSWKLTKVSDS